MTDDKTKRGAPDNDLIDIHDPNEIRNWTKSLGCSEQKLRAAVAAVGSSAAGVREWLRRNP